MLFIAANITRQLNGFRTRLGIGRVGGDGRKKHMGQYECRSAGNFRQKTEDECLVNIEGTGCCTAQAINVADAMRHPQTERDGK
ncbi:hypothetical protein A1O3_02776 [Capronia epimyces CBS 606.96]|uniref:Uncharacterized protein n=1 Tax=Capronia epimyces CBS 606.96 TaxID=1182542 RepID=W9Z5D2_9EURO|nr:uncharacterized protein A1O3_02776 [Capronia epimyces CBS 606.96]EXJ89709.1 hypothetical protein A1O3_02776 [Capronia epimyces CBS 606.96]